MGRIGLLEDDCAEGWAPKRLAVAFETEWAHAADVDIAWQSMPQHSKCMRGAWLWAASVIAVTLKARTGAYSASKGAR